MHVSLLLTALFFTSITQLFGQRVGANASATIVAPVGLLNDYKVDLDNIKVTEIGGHNSKLQEFSPTSKQQFNIYNTSIASLSILSPDQAYHISFPAYMLFTKRNSIEEMGMKVISVPVETSVKNGSSKFLLNATFSFSTSQVAGSYLSSPLTATINFN